MKPPPTNPTTSHDKTPRSIFYRGLDAQEFIPGGKSEVFLKATPTENSHDGNFGKRERAALTSVTNSSRNDSSSRIEFFLHSLLTNPNR
jgi:hypothetical protein